MDVIRIYISRCRCYSEGSDRSSLFVHKRPYAKTVLANYLENNPCQTPFYLFSFLKWMIKSFFGASAFTFLNPRLFVEFIFVSKCIWCLYNKQKNRWFPVDMEFPVSCSTLTNECSEREEKLSTCAHLLWKTIMVRVGIVVIRPNKSLNSPLSPQTSFFTLKLIRN